MKKLLIGIALTLTTSLVSADQGNKLYGGLEYGSSRVKGQAQELANDLVGILGGSVTVTQDLSAYTGRLFLGYRVDEKLSIEGGFFRTGNFDVGATGRTSTGVSYTINGAVDAQGVDLSAVYFPMASKQNQEGIFLKGGIHSSSRSTSTTLVATGVRETTSSKDSGIGYLFGIGYDWKFSKDAFLRASITRLLRLGGESESDATFYGVGIGTAF
jgi:hypothetical protein